LNLPAPSGHPTLSSLSRDQLSQRLQREGIFLSIPPFVAHIRSPIPIVAEGLETLYADHSLLSESGTFADFHVSVEYGRRLPKPLCVFKTDGHEPFTPLVAGEAFAFLEWGMNWCVTSYCHTWISIHSAVLERDGRALILPAPPGSGKSTLCAALLLNGWRLLSDEMTLLDPDTGMITPAPRPVSLKNQSIDIIRNLAPNVVIGPVAHDTMKGNVAHMRLPQVCLQRANEPALPAWVVFPKYVAELPAALVPRGKATSFMQLAENSFNQGGQGRRGFDALTALIETCDCYDFSYGHLPEAIATFARLPLPVKP
jgi:HprK-related kinase A